MRIFSIIFFFALCTGCQDSPPSFNESKSIQINALMNNIEDMKTKPLNTYFVFIDLSGSTGNKDTERAIKGFLNRVQPHFNTPGDQIVVIHVNEGSADPRNSYLFEIRANYPEIRDGDTQKTVLKKLAGFTSDLNKNQEDILRHIIKTHFKAPADAPFSHIITALTHIPRHIQKNEMEREYRILALTDGIEDSDFRTFSATSLEEAQEIASEDVQSLKDQYAMPNDALASINEVTFQLPRGENMSPNPILNFVPKYWEQIFLELGSSVKFIATGEVF